MNPRHKYLLAIGIFWLVASVVGGMGAYAIVWCFLEQPLLTSLALAISGLIIAFFWAMAQIANHDKSKKP